MNSSKILALCGLVAALVVLAAVPVVFADSSLARGWGDDIEWHTLEEGKALAKETGKPLMVIVHKSWCGACKRLKPQFAQSEDIKAYSKNFIMVNTEDNEEPTEEMYKPDGGYIPRILFADSEGQVDFAIYNQGGNPKYKYFYSSDTQVRDAMATAKAKLIDLNTDL